MASNNGGREHRVVQIPAAAGGGGAGAGSKLGATGPAEKRLNRFVRAVAMIERAGNSLGTLAFTWATVILLGGYPTVLRPRTDFWFATIIVFLEAARMFSRDNNRSDYQLFFRTRGVFRSLGWNGLVLIVCVNDLLVWKMITLKSQGTLRLMLILMVALAIGIFLFSRLRRAVSLWSPLVAILLLAPSIPCNYENNGQVHKHIFTKSITKWTVYLVLLVVVLLSTIIRLRFERIVKLVDNALGSKLLSWRQDILNMCMFAAIGMSVSTFDGTYQIAIITIDVCVLVIVSFGNLQFPAAVLLRVVLALMRLIPHNYISGVENNDSGTKNLVPSLTIFYSMVLGQGVLYIVACILEAFSFLLRRSLILCVGFRGRLGEEYVNLYYAYAFDKCMGGAMFSRKKIGLATFAMDCLNFDSPKMQLYGVQMLHTFLQKEPFKTKAISKLTTSTRTMTSLFNMVNICRQDIKDLLLDTEIQPVKIDVLIQQVSKDMENSSVLKSWKKMVIYCLIPVEGQSNMDNQNSHILRHLKQVTKYWSVPEEEPSMDHDLLPILGLAIIDRLSVDLENCIEITKATGLVSKIIELTNNKTNINEMHRALMKGSSLKVLRRLSSTKGNFGVTLRQKISEHPFLLINLAKIFHDIGSNQEHREMVVEILRNLAIDGNTSAEIGHILGIISSLMHAFLNRRDVPLSTDSGHMLRKIAGQALAVLATESANNCLIMLMEPGYAIIKDLTLMIQGDIFKYVAVSLLWNIYVHVRSELDSCHLKEISYILREVLESIMEAEGAELEILVGLSSQICNIVPQDFARELEHDHIKEKFIKRLVHALNTNMVPTSRCPGIRRVILEQAIYMMECNPSCTDDFKKYSLMDALLLVERTPSRAENYRKFLGDAGVMKHNIPLSTLVARAKRCMSIVT